MQEAVEAVNAEKMFRNDTQIFLAEARIATTLQALLQLARYLYSREVWCRWIGRF